MDDEEGEAEVEGVGGEGAREALAETRAVRGAEAILRGLHPPCSCPLMEAPRFNEQTDFFSLQTNKVMIWPSK